MSVGREWFEKLMSFIGFGDNYEEDDEGELLSPTEKRRGKTPVLSLHTNPEMKIVVVSPKSFEDVEQLATHLKSRKPVVVNLSQTPKDVGRRIIDFLSGAVFALGGNTSKVTADTFLFVPSNVTILPGDSLIEFSRNNLPRKFEEKERKL